MYIKVFYSLRRIPDKPERLAIFFSIFFYHRVIELAPTKPVTGGWRKIY